MTEPQKHPDPNVQRGIDVLTGVAGLGGLAIFLVLAGLVVLFVIVGVLLVVALAG